MNHVDHGIELPQDFCIPKAKDLIPLALEECGPSQILLRHGGMLTSIELDHQATLHTTEIGDKWGNRMLTAKLRPSALPAAQAVPQLTLGIGLIVAEATSGCGQPRHAWRFPPVRSPSPRPSPPHAGERE